MLLNEFNYDRGLIAFDKKENKNYLVKKYLGGGGYSNVYLVENIKLNEELALKILDAEQIIKNLRKQNLDTVQIEFENIQKRFFHEAGLLKKTNHPNIVKIQDMSIATDTERNIDIPYILMPYIEGQNLKQRIEKNSALSFDETCKISEDVLSALDALHRGGVYHRDIKPANIMISKEDGKALLIDFGLAKDVMSGLTLTRTDFKIGSHFYMSPEQYKGFKNLNHLTDIYSFGIVLFEMLTGQLEKKHVNDPVPSVRNINNDLPVGIDEIISKAMAKKPEDRYQSAAEFLQALRELEEKQRGVKVIPELEKSESIVGDNVVLPKKNSINRYFLFSAIAIVLLIVFFIFNPFKTDPSIDRKFNDLLHSAYSSYESGDLQKAKSYLTQAKKQKNTPDITELENRIAAENKLNLEYTALTTFLKGDASDIEKISECHSFLKSYNNGPVTDAQKEMITDINAQKAALENNLNNDQKYMAFINETKEYINTGDWDKASESLEKARSLKNSPEIDELKTLIAAKLLETEKIEFEKNKNGDADYNTIKGSISLRKYLDFSGKYPQSTYIPDLKDRLKISEPALPPEMYWDQIKKNSKGYYEAVIGLDSNSHLMIFIPEKRLWIDKYEVSWEQFKAFAVSVNRSLPTVTNKMINPGNDYPAAVSYEEALAYCNKNGFRLPTTEEWEYAAGKGRFTFPWGNEFPDSNGTYRANFKSGEKINGEENDGYDGTASVKSFEAYSSPLGVVNMSGNLWEWANGNILKGGGYFSPPEYLAISKSATPGNNQKEGFRCVKDEK